MKMKEIEITLKAFELTQGIGQVLSGGTEKSTMAYVQIPKHWVEGEIVLALVEPSEYERLR